MAAVVTAVSGFDLGYVWKNQGGKAEPERTAGGYYINAAQGGEPPGRWFGPGAEALGFTPGQQVERQPYEAVYRQVNPETGEKLGRSPGNYPRYLEHLERLKAAEPHATADRVLELERQAARETRKSPAYTDMTVSLSKSVSVFHASMRENARLARLDGDTARAAYWDAAEARYQEVVQAANRAGLEYLQEQAGMTRTGRHGAKVDGKEQGRFEAAGMVVTSWLQGTSRDGDPQDHIHNQIARMVLTRRDGQWRALDTMSVRAQLGAVQGIVTAHAEAALAREFGVAWVPRADGLGNEIRGVTQEQMDAYSSRTQAIKDATPAAVAEWTAKYGRAPSRSELKFIQNEVTMATRSGKKEGVTDWEALAARWDATLGGKLAQVAPDVSGLGGAGAASRESDPRGPQPPSRDATAQAIRHAVDLAQTRDATWTRADLMRALATVLPPECREMAPADAVAWLRATADEALASKGVVSLEAPLWPAPPAELIRETDGRSVYTRPGRARYATEAQLRMEERLLASAQAQGAPRIEREDAARHLGATPEELSAQLHARVQESREALASGLRLDQAAALAHALTSDRMLEVIVGPAGSGKTRTLAEAARMWPGLVVGVTPSQASRNVLRAAGVAEAYNFAQFLREHGPGPLPLQPGSLVVIDEGSMLSTSDMQKIVSHAEACGAKVLMAGDQEQLASVEGGGGMMLAAHKLGYTQLAEPVRFSQEWERDASLRMRAGDICVLADYAEHGRIRGAEPEDVKDAAVRAYVARTMAGQDVLLMAKDWANCRELSQRIRDELQHLGQVDATGQEASLAEGQTASAGDLIIAGLNDHRQHIANGDTLRVESVTPEGAIIARPLLDADPETGERRYGLHVKLGSSYLAHHADLAYATTAHSAQGRTVAWAEALVTGNEDRQWLYVALSRATEGSTAHVATARREADPLPGTRPAPELARAERIQQERAGFYKPAAGHPQDEALGVLADVMERDGAQVSAMEVQRRNLANADHLAALAAVFEGETRAAASERYAGLLREVLPEGYEDAAESHRMTWLARSLRHAEVAGLDARDVLRQAAGERGLDDARDVVAVIDSRVRQQTAHLLPLPALPWLERIPDLGGEDRQRYVTEVAAAMDERTQRLGEFAAETAPAWLVRGLGLVPDQPLDRLEYEGRAAKVAAYRELYGYEHSADPIGPEPPSTSPEARAAWHAAFASLGPADGMDVRKETDGRLLHMRSTYEATTAWAPRHVARDLESMRAAAEDSFLRAEQAKAEADAAAERGDTGLASLHATHAESARAAERVYRDREAQLAEAADDRREWERTTEAERHIALAADTEYRTRYPQETLEPMRSVEPPAPDEEERLQALDAEKPEPEWMTRLAEARETFREQMESRQGVMIPSEDPDYEDEGEAWPTALQRDRDAIIQPPRAEMPPAEPVAAAAKRSRERDMEPEAGA